MQKTNEFWPEFKSVQLSKLIYFCLNAVYDTKSFCLQLFELWALVNTLTSS